MRVSAIGFPCVVFLFSLFLLSGPALALNDQPGFEGTVQSVNLQSKTLLLEAKIAGYGGSTSVFVGVERLEDQSGNALSLRELKQEDQVFVLYSGPFLESLPLQLMGKAKVIKVEPTHELEGRISAIENRGGGNVRLYVGEGGPSSMVIVRVSPDTELPAKPLQEGDGIVATYDGMVLESNPPQIYAMAIRLKTPMKPAGFDAVVDDVLVWDDKERLVVRADLPGYGSTLVSVAPSALVDESGKPAKARKGDKVFVEYQGGFLESYPLQLGVQPRVVVKGGGNSEPLAKEGFSGLVREVWKHNGKASFMFEGNIPGYGAGIQCRFGVKELVDASGQPASLSRLKPGTRVRVVYSGIFFETLPLKAGLAKVIIE